MEHFLPVGEYEPLPEDLGTLFILANCKLSGGHQFEGYVVGTGSIYALNLFVDERSFMFNANLQGLADEEASQMAGFLSIDVRDVFPIHYETCFGFPGSENLSGEFDFA
ncbi:hypothetical protein LzC2_27650 [Planctomycetes bacterium LzC2]|uniref:Uncharacterized protein n=2 Tax=Alienimonas chondri TaxID=2681879 RepID=A0ABX1VGJ4_9PLAN|nr:hypothetical protein [Alienimonas chondri]